MSVDIVSPADAVFRCIGTAGMSQKAVETSPEGRSPSSSGGWVKGTRACRCTHGLSSGWHTHAATASSSRRVRERMQTPSSSERRRFSDSRWNERSKAFRKILGMERDLHHVGPPGLDGTGACRGAGPHRAVGTAHAHEVRTIQLEPHAHLLEVRRAACLGRERTCKAPRALQGLLSGRGGDAAQGREEERRTQAAAHARTPEGRGAVDGRNDSARGALCALWR